MSKSLGNIYTLRDLKERGYAPEALRYLLASVPYRKALNFTFDGLKSAATSIERLRNYKLRLETGKFAERDASGLLVRTAQARKDFDSSLDDDLNTAQALASVFEYVRETNTLMDSGEFPAAAVEPALGLLDRFDSVFDVLLPNTKEAHSQTPRSRLASPSGRKPRRRRISPERTEFARNCWNRASSLRTPRMASAGRGNSRADSHQGSPCG
jgi:cysteinyl-tRNA synthetase